MQQILWWIQRTIMELFRSKSRSRNVDLLFYLSLFPAMTNANIMGKVLFYTYVIDKNLKFKSTNSFFN